MILGDILFLFIRNHELRKKEKSHELTKKAQNNKSKHLHYKIGILEKDIHKYSSKIVL